MQSPRETIRLPSGRTFRLLRWRRDLAHVEVVEGPGRVSSTRGFGAHWHYHPELELTLFLKGSGTRFVADHIELFEPGDLVLLGANVPHTWHPKGASAGISLQWDLPLNHGLWQIGEIAAPLRRLCDQALRGLLVRGTTAADIERQMERIAGIDGLGRFAAFLELLGLLAEAPAAHLRPLSERPFALAGTAEQQEAIRRAVSYILAHYREAVRLEDLHALTGMSRATFARQFQRHAGKPFSTFLNQVRLQAVCRALRDTGEAIGAIALGNGFNQLSFFNRLFRRECGVSPGEYRERARKKRDRKRSGDGSR